MTIVGRSGSRERNKTAVALAVGALLATNGSLQTLLSDEVSGGSFLPDWQPLRPRR